MPLPIFLLYYHGINQPLGVKDLFDCPYLLKFVHFYPYYLSMLFWWTSRRLLSWDHLWIHIQPVTYKLRINLMYVISTPGKHINIIFQKFHQRGFFQGWQLRPHLKVFFFVLTNQNLFPTPQTAPPATQSQVLLAPFPPWLDLWVAL